MKSPHTEQSVLNLTIKDCHLIIPAAGMGKRMHTLTGGSPKEMLPINGRPLILIAVLEGIKAGIQNMTIVINKKKEILRAFFEDEGFIRRNFPALAEEIRNLRDKSRIHFVYQDAPLGEADAIACAESTIPSRKPVATVYPDNVSFSTKPVLAVLFSHFQKTGHDTIGLMQVKKNILPGLSYSGRLELHRLSGQIYEVKRILDKSSGSFPEKGINTLRGCGFSISGYHIFDYIRKARKLMGDSESRELIDIDFRRLILKDQMIIGVKIPGIIMDVGNPTGYKLCCEFSENFNSSKFIT